MQDIFHKQKGNKAFVLLLGNSAYKCFYGRGARNLMMLEMEYSRNAQSCAVWGPHTLPLDKSRIPLTLRSDRGNPLITAERQQVAQVLIESLCVSAISTNLRASAYTLLPTDWLFASLDPRKQSYVATKAQELLLPLKLPKGPAHGDLHIGNILDFGTSLKVFDSRYRKISSPVFDLIHYRLSETQKIRGGRWLDVLIASEMWIGDVIDDVGVSRDSFRKISLAYGLNRIALESHYWALQGEIREKFTVMALHLLDYCEQV